MGGALLGAAALAKTANAEPDEPTSFLYAEGVVWNRELPGLRGQWRLNVYLAVVGDGTGTGTLSDPVHSGVNSHLHVSRTIQRGNRYTFYAEITESNDAALVGQLLVIPALVHGEGTILTLYVGNDFFPGLGRIVNVRVNANALSLGAPLLPSSIQ